MGRRSQGQPVTVVDIEKAAALVFRRVGYAGSTMQQIAAEVGLHKTSLYHHISSKQALLVSIAGTAIDEPLRKLEQIAADPSLDRVEKLRRAVYMQVLAVTESTDQIAAFTMYINEIEDDKTRLEFSERRKKYSFMFQGLVASCRGVPPADANAYIITFGILGIINWMLFWYQPDMPQAPETLATIYAEMAVRSALA